MTKGTYDILIEVEGSHVRKPVNGYIYAPDSDWQIGVHYSEELHVYVASDLRTGASIAQSKSRSDAYILALDRLNALDDFAISRLTKARERFERSVRYGSDDYYSLIGRRL